MLARFWCWLLGHHFWEKAVIPGSAHMVTNALGQEMTQQHYDWAALPFCLGAVVAIPL